MLGKKRTNSFRSSSHFFRYPQSNRPRLLILVAACNPYKGSEFKVGWERARLAAQDFGVWAICGEWDRADIEHYLSQNGDIPHLQFFFVAQSWFERVFESKAPLFEIHYLAHYLWHRRVFRLANRLHRNCKFDLVHHATRTGYREPGFLWKLDAPFIWGPVSGTQNYPWRFLFSGGVREGLMEGIRSLVNNFQFRFSHRVRCAMRKARVVLSANSQIQRDFWRVHHVKTQQLLETGLDCVAEEASIEKKGASDSLRILWSGKFKAHKALHLLLIALSQLPPKICYELKILGEGSLRNTWQQLTMGLGVADRCRWLGWLPYAEALRQYDWADVLVFTSLRDTSGNVVLEALSHGVPVICLDHQGVRDIITPECGLKIPVTTPKEVILRLRDAIVTLAEDEDKLLVLSRGAINRARYYLWSHNGEQMARVYQSILSLKSRKS